MRKVVTILFLTALAAAIEATLAPAEDWKPAAGPLMTRWAADVSPENALPEYPRPQMVRSNWMNLNGLWQLAFAEADQQPPTGQDLPEQILVPYPVESALSGVMKRADRLWYRRTFEIPADWKDRRVLLHFGAVDWEATVYVNGQEVGVHRGGYDPFTLDITPALKDGGPQELIVGVFDPTDAGKQPRGKQVNNPNGIWYTPTTGIWQTVWLEPVAETHIRSIHLVPNLDDSSLDVQVDLLGLGAGKAFTVEAVAKADDQEVARGEMTVATSQFAGQGVPVSVRLPIEKPKLWTPDTPFLYDLTITVKQDDQPVDAIDSYFGMRSIAVGKDENGVLRPMLNGQFVFQVGPLDQGFWPDGLYTAPTDEALRYDIEIMKKLGFNMARKHVKVEPARWYYWCDKLGLMVWQDMPSAWAQDGPPEAKQQFERELERLVQTHWNHPSIILWVVFNEGWGQYDTVRLTERVKQMDPHRLVTCASGWTDFPTGDVIDKHAYPGPAGVEPNDNRIGVLGEFGGLKLAVPDHMWSSESWGYRTVEGAEQLTQRYESLLAAGWGLKDKVGTSTLVYTQITDVEIEANGLLTYDRAVVKVDIDRAAAANRGIVPIYKDVIPTAEKEPQPWRYTTEPPAEGWMKGDFDDSAWQEGQAGFGAGDPPNVTIRSKWDAPTIWMRRTVELPEQKPENPMLRLYHDEDAEIYINGVLAAKTEGYVTDYIEIPISAEAAATLKSGKNVIAVVCKQTGGGQFIDVGLGDSQKPEENSPSGGPAL